MTDLALRQLDRAARAGDPEAEVRALRERMRRGEVEQVRLLAWCGDKAAERVCGAYCDFFPGPGGDTLTVSWQVVESLTPEDWARGLAPLLVAALDREATWRVFAAIHAATWPGHHDDQLFHDSWSRSWAERLHGDTSRWSGLDDDAWTTGYVTQRLGPQLRPVVLAAVRREVWG